MMKPIVSALFIFPVLFFVACSSNKGDPSTSTATPFSNYQLSSRFYYDLGQATIDVSRYPSKIQEDYKLFLAVCNSCHSSARALNSPLTSRNDWRRYVKRMHLKVQNRGFDLNAEDKKRIANFLVHDSKVRKVGEKNKFMAEQKQLQILFKEVSKEKERLTLEKTERLPKKEPPYTGVK